MHKKNLKLLQKYENKSTCIAKKVGCIIISNKSDKLLSYGWNTTIIGSKCNELFVRNDNKHITCINDDIHDTHNYWSKHNEIHAEMMALMNLLKNNYIHNSNDYLKMYVSWSPCMTCMLSIAQTDLIKEIYYKNTYDNLSEIMKIALNYKITVTKIT